MNVFGCLFNLFLTQTSLLGHTKQLSLVSLVWGTSRVLLSAPAHLSQRKMRWTYFVTVMIMNQGNMNALPTEAMKYPAMHFHKIELHKHLLDTV